MSRSITLTVNSGVATLTLSQPEIRNAFSDETIAELLRALQDVAERPTLRALVLAADGPAFCAGANLHWMRQMAEYDDAQNQHDAGQLAAMLHALYTCPVPTIARIQGDVFAGGMGLVACCDMAVAVEAAQFCLSEVKIGLVPATIAPYVLRAMGPRAGQRHFLTGERFDSAEALRLGFVHQVVAAEQLDDAVDSLLKHLLQSGPQATRACKQLLREVNGRTIDTALMSHTVQTIARIRASDEGKEGVQAFLGKRKPSWLS